MAVEAEGKWGSLEFCVVKNMKKTLEASLKNTETWASRREERSNKENGIEKENQWIVYQKPVEGCFTKDDLIDRAKCHPRLTNNDWCFTTAFNNKGNLY